METRPQDDGSTAKGANWLLLILLIFGYAVYNLDKNVIAILIEPLKAEFGISDGQIGILTGIASTAPFALACIPIGLLADRVNRKRLLIILMIGWSFMTGVAGLATVVGVLYISRIGIGAFEGGFTPVSVSLITDSFHKDRRATAIGLFNIGAPFGIFLGLAVGGVVAAELGWRAAFFLAGAPGLVIAGLLAILVVEPARGQFDPVQDKNETAPLGAILGNMWRDRALFHVAMGMTLCAVLLASYAIWTPSFLIRVHGAPLKEAGFIAAIAVGVFGATGAATGGWLGDKLGEKEAWRRLLAPVIGVPIAIIVALLGYLWAPTILAAGILLSMAAFFGQWYIGVGYATASSLAPANMRAATISILLVAFNIGSVALGSAIVGWVSDAVAPNVGARAIAFGMSATALLATWGVLHFARALYLIRGRAPISETQEVFERSL